MTFRAVATVGNGRVLAKFGVGGRLVSLRGPHLDHELLDEPVDAVLPAVDGRRRRVGGRDWKHHLAYVRGTNVLRVQSTHSSGLKLERRLAAIGESLRSALRSNGDAEVVWERGLDEILPQAGVRFDGVWPEEFDPPPLGGATRAALVARVPDLGDRAAVTELYARSVLLIAQHHDRSGAFAAARGDDVLLAHALDVCGERGAARAFFELAHDKERHDPHLAWALERHLRRSQSPALREWLEELQSTAILLRPPQPPAGTAATLWTAWQLAVDSRRDEAIALLQTAVVKRSPIGLFLAGTGIDLRAHALLLLSVNALIPSAASGEDGFFEHQATVQKTRHARALYAGAFHPGMPEPAETVLVAEVRPDLDVSKITLDKTGNHAEELAALRTQPGGPARWSGPVPPTAAGEVSRYRIRVHLRDPDATPMWASDSDPRPGGQEFAFEAAPPPPPDWVHDGVCYQVMVDRFARPGEGLPRPGDSTALYGGTLDGVREHIDHIAGLGCNVLWLSPVHRSPSHHGYDYEDFLEVEPRYGGNAALVRLVESAHSRGMRVLLDFVPNHTGRGHHLFRDAIKKDGDAASYYRFWQWPHYYRCFEDVITLPELDTGSHHVQQHLVRAAQHWLTAYGVDGVRCDHVAGVDPAFWVELRRGLREVKADPLILGEATGVPEWLARYAGRIDAIFDFDLAYYARQALARGRMDASSFASWLDEHDSAYPGMVLATLLDNHDMNRFLWMANGSTDRLKLAATLLLTLPGMPVIYYGTEVGVSQRQDCAIENAEARLPMLWGADQDEDLLGHFRLLGRMRRESIALRRGARRTVLADPEVFAYERSAGDETVLVALNFSEQRQTREVRGRAEQIELEPLGSAIVPIGTRGGLAVSGTGA
ncbi:MAG TPA: alpha-amylase family glycosyl hydrolase [Candidatus Dormibacteraeota bacterium]|nr:alpha-amylase family glycosyl hydrolase [Candidatus Dormibacteraeota bacterium]